MTDSTLTAGSTGPATPASVEELAQRLPGFQSGARWFWWIAGLTAVNVALDLGHANINFILGLAFTQLAHAAFAGQMGVAIVADALFIGGFWLIGRQAQKGQTWAFVLGAAVYVVDGLIYLNFQAWLPVAFHAYALFAIGKAFMSLQTAKKATVIR
ncbi:MAG TPA: hypothetical protein VIP05_26115 [Burkholderiaceae bacterium]